EAESICLDILAADPDHGPALITLLLALTDQFGVRRGPATVQDARALLPRLPTEYDREYYAGIVCERWAKAQLKAEMPGHTTYEWLESAMTHYTAAEKLAPPGNADAILRWNACSRVLAQNPQLRPKDDDRDVYGDDPP